VDTCLFDVDGTLLDSREPILHALNSALTEHGLDPLSDVELSPYIGPPLQAMLEMLVDERGVARALIPDLIRDYRAAYRIVAVEMAVTYPGVADLLAGLHNHVRLGVATSKPLTFTDPILEALGFASMFEVVAGPSLTKSESKRDTMARAIKLMEDTSEVGALVMVGDRHHDIEAGIDHGARTIGVTWGFGSRAELTHAGADYIVDHPSEIIELAL